MTVATKRRVRRYQAAIAIGLATGSRFCQVFDVDPAQTESGPHGFDFSFAGSKGVLVPPEADYQTSFANDPYPRRYDVGVVFDRSPYSYTVNNAAFSPGSGGGYGRSIV